MVSIGL